MASGNKRETIPDGFFEKLYGSGIAAGNTGKYSLLGEILVQPPLPGGGDDGAGKPAHAEI